jgi:hypothetical protein
MTRCWRRTRTAFASLRTTQRPSTPIECPHSFPLPRKPDGTRHQSTPTEWCARGVEPKSAHSRCFSCPLCHQVLPCRCRTGDTGHDSSVLLPARQLVHLQSAGAALPLRAFFLLRQAAGRRGVREMGLDWCALTCPLIDVRAHELTLPHARSHPTKPNRAFGSMGCQLDLASCTLRQGVPLKRPSRD